MAVITSQSSQVVMVHSLNRLLCSYEPFLKLLMLQNTKFIFNKYLRMFSHIQLYLERTFSPFSFYDGIFSICLLFLFLDEDDFPEIKEKCATFETLYELHVETLLK